MVEAPGRDELSTTTAPETRCPKPCACNQSRVAPALRAPSMAGEVTRMSELAMSSTPFIAEWLNPVPQSVMMML